VSLNKTPQIYLLSRPNFDVEAFLKFLCEEEGLSWRRTQGATQAEEIVEASGRICYMSFGAGQSPRDNLQYVQNLIRMGHESVLEHVSWTFLITGVSRAFTHQLVRHRVGFAFSQLSQQYHDEQDATFVVPQGLEEIPEAMNVWSRAMESAKRAYADMINVLTENESKIRGPLNKKEFQRNIRSAARSVLPQATQTKIIVSANARAIRHLFKIRGSIPGDLEMRSVCSVLFNTLQPEAPSLFFDFALKTFSDGSPAVVNMTEQNLSLVS
jgi:thymidylate synthase (FAD)